MICKEEIQLVRDSLAYAQSQGAQKARITLSKSCEDLVAVLNGEIDRVTHCLDRSVSIALFVDGRYGSFSTNKLAAEALKDFISKAIETTRMLTADPCRDLPSPDRCCREAVTGNELDLMDPDFDSITPEQRRQAALDAAVFNRWNSEHADEDYELISEEAEYSNSIYDTIVMDTNGLDCRHTETSFDYGVEVTIECEGEKYSGYWWHSSARKDGLDTASCGIKAIQRAAAQIGSDAIDGGSFNMVVDSEVASRVVSPLLRVLSAYAIQQNNSFLADSLGKKVFAEGLTIMDRPRIMGQTCSKLFDSEGVATVEGPIIENGVVKQYFVNSYMANKTGMEPTIEDPTRPCVLPWPQKGLDKDAIMKMCGSGILVTEFNGGNCNSATGDFSYGIEGFRFEDGEIREPVSGMLVTGNFLTLWNNLIAAGSDARSCLSKLIPTLAFANVDFSG